MGDKELNSATIQVTEKADGSYNLVITTFDNQIYFYGDVPEKSIGSRLLMAMKDAIGEHNVF